MTAVFGPHPDADPLAHLPADDQALLRLVTWIAQADGEVAPEEADLLEHLVASRLLARGRGGDPDAAAARLCREPVRPEELPHLVAQLQSPGQRRRVAVLARRMLNSHRAEGEGPEGQPLEQSALERLQALLDPTPIDGTNRAIESHMLRKTLRGSLLPPLPESVVRLESDEDLNLVTPAGFCPRSLRWDTPIGPVPAFLGELGLLGMPRQTAYYGYSPRRSCALQGLLLFPGGGVDFRAYAPIARELARQGLVVVVQNVPFGYALLDRDRALGPGGNLRQAFPQVRSWSVGGHSLGGVAAACYVHQHPRDVERLVLWGSFPSPTHSLAPRTLPVASLCGSEDGLVNPARIQATRHLLPAQTRVVELAGANHTQFGDYWDGSDARFLQRGDRPALLSRSQQRRRVVDATTAFLLHPH